MNIIKIFRWNSKPTTEIISNIKNIGDIIHQVKSYLAPDDVKELKICEEQLTYRTNA